MKNSCDNILKIIDNIDSNFYNNILTFEKSQDFRGDNTCLRDGLSRYDLLIKHQKCYSCRLFDIFFKDDTIPSTIKIMTGKNKNNKILINKDTQDKYSLVYLSNLSTYLENYNKDITVYYTLEKHFPDTKCFSSSNKSLNLCIINNILKNIIKEKKFIRYNKFLYHYICNNNLLSFKYSYDIESLEELLDMDSYQTKENCKKILYLLILYFKFFSNYYFTHNKPSLEYLKFDLEVFSITENKKTITFPFRMYIEPSCYSSITLFREDLVKRFFYHGEIEKNINTLPFEDFDIDINGSKNYNTKKINIEYTDGYLEKRLIFYKIGNRYTDFLDMRRFQGVPLVSKSFDIVLFFISLLLEKNYYLNFIKNYYLLAIWKGLWKNNQYENLMKDLEILRNKNLKKFDNIYNVIKKYYIRFDALEYLYVSLSTSW